MAATAITLERRRLTSTVSRDVAVLVSLTVLAAVLRISTLGLQSFWYDEAFTPVHVLHHSLWATLRAVAHTENTPPLWYTLEWFFWRTFGDGAVALRLLSALAGIACVPVCFAIGWQLAGRRAAYLTAALIAVHPLMVWFSQEARAYELFALMSALTFLCFLRALERPTLRRMYVFALTGALAMLTHYFAVFWLIGMVIWIVAKPATRRAGLGAIAVLAAVGVALIPLLSSQHARGTQWIGRWALVSRLQAIPQYYLTGYSGGPLGHGVQLLIAAPIVAGVLWSLWCGLERGEERGALTSISIAAGATLIPLAMIATGIDVLAPRNLLGAMVIFTGTLGVVIGARRAGRAGMAFSALTTIALLAVTIDVNLSPRLQRGDWSGLARALAGPSRERVITTVELGAAPLEYYMPGLRNATRDSTLMVREVDETGYRPLRHSAGQPPAPGFRLIARRQIHGLILYRFVSPVAVRISEASLRRHVITLAHPEVLVAPVSK